jgi:ubiquinone/menaquinone biosynthesis C-methylase UbiE
MKELNFLENLTPDKKYAESIWNYVSHSIEKVGRVDILKKPKVLDLGGGMGEFSKGLNGQNIDCVSLDIEDLEKNLGANQINADAYKMPFKDESFDIIYERGLFDDNIYPHNFCKLLKEISRVLKSKGILSIYDADHPSNEELQKHFRILTPCDEFPTLWEKI